MCIIRIDYTVMQGRFAALSFKYNVYHVLSFTNIVYYQIAKGKCFVTV